MLTLEKTIGLGSFKIGKSNEPGAKCPFMMACRDYESKWEEAWTLAWLSEDEAKEVYETLKAYFD